MAGMNDEGRQWYVVCTYNGHENKVKENLEKHPLNVLLMLGSNGITRLLI